MRELTQRLDAASPLLLPLLFVTGRQWQQRKGGSTEVKASRGGAAPPCTPIDMGLFRILEGLVQEITNRTLLTCKGWRSDTQRMHQRAFCQMTPGRTSPFSFKGLTKGLFHHSLNQESGEVKKLLSAFGSSIFHRLAPASLRGSRCQLQDPVPGCPLVQLVDLEGELSTEIINPGGIFYTIKYAVGHCCAEEASIHYQCHTPCVSFLERITMATPVSRLNWAASHKTWASQQGQLQVLGGPGQRVPRTSLHSSAHHQALMPSPTPACLSPAWVSFPCLPPTARAHNSLQTFLQWHQAAHAAGSTGGAVPASAWAGGADRSGLSRDPGPWQLLHCRVC